MKRKILSLFCICFLFMSFSVCAAEETAVLQLEGGSLFQEGNLSVRQELVSLQSMEELEAEILTALRNVEGTLNIKKYNISMQEAQEIFLDVVDNHPELFYVRSSIGVSYNPGTGKASAYNFENAYAYTDPAIIAERKAIIDTRTNLILSGVENGMSDAEIALYIHDRLVELCAYDTETAEISSQMYTDENWKSFRIDGVFIEQTAVCQGYSLAYMYLMNIMDIPTIYTASRPMGHAWNMVQMEGKWYHVDVTWDDPVTEYGDIFSYVGHENFLLSDADISATGHSGWEATQTAGETYTGIWDGIEGGMQYKNGTWYYVSGNGMAGYIAANKNGTETVIYNFTGAWAYMSQYASRIGIYKDRIYFNTGTDIRSILLTGEEEDVFVTPVIGSKNICGMIVDGDAIFYAIGEGPYEKLDICIPIYLGFDFRVQVQDKKVVVTTGGHVMDDSRFFVAGYQGNTLVDLKVLHINSDVTRYETEITALADRVCVMAFTGIIPKANKFEQSL